MCSLAAKFDDKPAKIAHGQVVGRMDMAVPGPVVQSLPARNWFAA